MIGIPPKSLISRWAWVLLAWNAHAGHTTTNRVQDQMHSPRWGRRSPVGWKQAAAKLLALWLRVRVEVVQQQQRKQRPFAVISCSGAEWQEMAVDKHHATPLTRYIKAQPFDSPPSNRPETSHETRVSFTTPVLFGSF